VRESQCAKMAVMRRIQAAGVVLALLAVPLALVARGQVCASQQCVMACCRGHHAMKCGRGAAGMSHCAMCSESRPMPDYGLASPIAPFDLPASVELPRPVAARAVSVVMAVSDSAGHFSPPFNPPRA
jgi:hypothetical protein